MRKQTKWNLGGGKGPLINIWFAAGWCFRLYLKYIMFAGTSLHSCWYKAQRESDYGNSNRVFIYLCICVHACAYVYTHIHSHTHRHTKLVKVILKILFALIFTGTGNHFYTKGLRWQQQVLMKIFQERSLETYQHLQSVHKHTLTSECLSYNQKETQLSAGTDSVTIRDKRHFTFRIFFF